MIILGLVGIITFGFLIADILLPRNHLLEKLSLGYLLGLGIFTFALFLANLTGLPYKLIPASLILLLLNLTGLTVNLLSKQRQKESNFSFMQTLQKPWIWRISFKNITPLEAAFIGIIAFLLISSFISDIYWPVKTWDALAVYDFRAKSFLATGFMEDAIARGYFSKYPLLTSLSHTWLYLLDYPNPMIIYFLLYLGGVLILYFSLRRYLSRVFSLFFTTLFASSTPIFYHSQIAYTNLPYTVYSSISFFYLYHWLKSGKANLAYISASMIALSTWARYQEPFWVPILLIIIIKGILSRKWLTAGLALSVFIIIYTAWSVFIQLNLGSSSLVVNQNIGLLNTIFMNLDPGRMTEVLAYLWTYIINPNLFLLLVFIFTVPFMLKREWPEKLIGLVIVINLATILAGTLVFSVERDSWSQIGGSAQRMSMFLIPYLIFYIAMILVRKIERFKENKAKTSA